MLNCMRGGHRTVGGADGVYNGAENVEKSQAVSSICWFYVASYGEALCTSHHYGMQTVSTSRTVRLFVADRGGRAFN